MQIIPGFDRRLWAGRLGLCALISLVSVTAQADSLFPVQQANKSLNGSNAARIATLFSDTKAHEVGDILTITIAENTTAQSAANTKTSRDESVSAFGGTGLWDRLFKQLSLSATNSRSGSGSGQTSRSGSLVTTLSVVVKDILPNGTMKVEGSRMVGINKETQRVVFSGLVRPEDINPDNSVPSTQVAGVEVHYDGRGVVADTQRRGILGTIFHFLF